MDREGLLGRVGGIGYGRKRERQREREREEGEAGRELFFFSVLSPYDGRERGRCCLSRWWKLREMKEGGTRQGGVGSAGWQVESSRRLDATGGGLGCTFHGLRRGKEMWAPLCGKGDRNDVGGVANRVEEPTWSPSYGAAPAAHRVIASPGQASRVRPLLYTTPSGLTSPSWRSVG